MIHTASSSSSPSPSPSQRVHRGHGNARPKSKATRTEGRVKRAKTTGRENQPPRTGANPTAVSGAQLATRCPLQPKPVNNTKSGRVAWDASDPSVGPTGAPDRTVDSSQPTPASSKAAAPSSFTKWNIEQRRQATFRVLFGQPLLAQRGTTTGVDGLTALSGLNVFKKAPLSIRRGANNSTLAVETLGNAHECAVPTPSRADPDALSFLTPLNAFQAGEDDLTSGFGDRTDDPDDFLPNLQIGDEPISADDLPPLSPQSDETDADELLLFVGMDASHTAVSDSFLVEQLKREDTSQTLASQLELSPTDDLDAIINLIDANDAASSKGFETLKVGDENDPVVN